MTRDDCIVPDWSAPACVEALMTTRKGGVSKGTYASLNLGASTADDPLAVAENRRALRALLPAEPSWLSQVHGNGVVRAPFTERPDADASVTRQPGVVLTVAVADCLPVLLADRAGSVIGAAHAGWRGLSAGVIENTVAAMDAVPGELVAWLGPAIGAARFEVGQEVYEAFVLHDAAAAACFKPMPAGKWLADLYGLARRRLAALGVADVSGGDCCTISDEERFFSHRREKMSGRMAALLWINPSRARA